MNVIIIVIIIFKRRGTIRGAKDSREGTIVLSSYSDVVGIDVQSTL